MDSKNSVAPNRSSFETQLDVNKNSIAGGDGKLAYKVRPMKNPTHVMRFNTTPEITSVLSLTIKHLEQITLYDPAGTNLIREKGRTKGKPSSLPLFSLTMDT